MMKRFNKLCSLLLTFAVTATTVFSADMSMVTAFADDDVQAVAVEEEQTEDAVAVAAVEADVDAAIADAVVEEAVVADETAVAVEEAEVVADEEIAADDEVTGEVTEADEVEDAEGGRQEFDSVRKSTKFSAFKVASVSANVDADGDIENYFVAIEYTLKADQAKPEANEFIIDSEPMTTAKVVSEITEKGVTFKVSAVHSGVGHVYCNYADGYVMAEVIFDIDSLHYTDDYTGRPVYNMDSNTVSSNKGIIVTFHVDDETFGWYPKDTKGVIVSKKISDTKGNYYYTGKPVKPHVVVYDGDARLTEGVDYTVKYKNNTKPYNQLNLSASAVGTSYIDDANAPKDAPYVEIVGKGTYAKELNQKKYFNIVPAEIKPCNLKDEWNGSWTDEDHDNYSAMVHADGTIKKDYIVIKAGKEAKVKTDVSIYSDIKYTLDKKDNRKYKLSTTKLKTKGDNGDYFVKYISYNGLKAYCKDQYGYTSWSLTKLAEASDKAWNDPKAVDKVTEVNDYIVLVSGNAAEGKLEAKAMAVANFTVVDAEHDVSKAKITVSSESVVSYNKIALGMREYDEVTELGGDEFEVNPASITSMKIGKTELTPEQIVNFKFVIADDDQKVGKNRRITVSTSKKANAEGYFGRAICKTKFEITADKDIKDLKALLVAEVAGKTIIKEFDDKGNVDVDYAEISVGKLSDYDSYIVLSENAAPNRYYEIDNDCFVDYIAKPVDKYVGKYTYKLAGIGVDGYAGSRNLTVNVKPIDVMIEMVSMNSHKHGSKGTTPIQWVGLTDNNNEEFYMAADKSKMIYAPYYGKDKEGKEIAGLQYRPSNYYETIFNGLEFRSGVKAETMRDNSYYRIKIDNFNVETIDNAYDVKIKINGKKNAGETVDGTFTYKGAINGSIPFEFSLKETTYGLDADDVALKVSDNFMYSAKKCASKPIAYKWAYTGYKFNKNGYAYLTNKQFILKSGKDYTLDEARYTGRKYDDEASKYVMDKPFAEGDPVVGKTLYYCATGVGNYANYNTYNTYRVGIDIKVFKKQIDELVKEGLIAANKIQGSEDTNKAQIGQKYDKDYLTNIIGYMQGKKLNGSSAKLLVDPAVGTEVLIGGYTYDKDVSGNAKNVNLMNGIAGKQYLYVWGDGVLVGTYCPKIDVDTRKKAEVTDYKYVLSK